MTQLDQLQMLSNRVNVQIGVLNTLIASGRPQVVQRIPYLGARFYLQQLVIYLSQIEDTLLSAIADEPLPFPPSYTFVQDNMNGTFDFEIQTTGGVQSFTGRITHVNNGDDIDDTYIWFPMTVFGSFTSDPEGVEEIAETRLLQTRYGYLALRVAWDIYQPSIPLDAKLLLAIFYAGELQITSNYRLEALIRNFFDPQTGGCPAVQDCTYENMIRILSASQFWYNRTEAVEDNGVAYARSRIDGALDGVGLLKQAHISTLEADQAANRGPFSFDSYISSVFTQYLDWLRFPGQSANYASRWANFTLLPTEKAALLDNKTEIQQFQAIQDYLRTVNEDN